MKRHIATIAFVLLLLAGLSLLLYPTISNYANELKQKQEASNYVHAVQEANNVEVETLLQNARDYNAALAQSGNKWVLSDVEMQAYESQLRVHGTEVISSVHIPSIACSLPIYHGTSESVLQIGIGHIEGSSLPVGGESVHCVLSGHRGLPSSKLFSDLNKVEVGEYFVIETLGESFYYEVDRILTVLPHELNNLKVVEAEDRCTLVTCTPYGVNTHRLLVQGKRVDETEILSRAITADALQVEPLIVASAIAAPILLIMFIVAMTFRKKDADGAPRARRVS